MKRVLYRYVSAMLNLISNFSFITGHSSSSDLRLEIVRIKNAIGASNRINASRVAVLACCGIQDNMLFSPIRTTKHPTIARLLARYAHCAFEWIPNPDYKCLPFFARRLRRRIVLTHRKRWTPGPWYLRSLASCVCVAVSGCSGKLLEGSVCSRVLIIGLCRGFPAVMQALASC